MTGLTAAETADGVGRALWRSERALEVLGDWTEPTMEPGDRVWADTVRRRLAQHVDIWRDQLPESVLLEPADRIVAGPGDEQRLRALVDAGTDDDRRSSLEAWLTVMAEDLDALLVGAGPVADGALVRMGSFVADDLRSLTARE